MLREQLRESLTTAMKNRDQSTVSTLRLVTSALKEKDRLHTAEQGKLPLSDAEIMAMIQTMLKQRHESIKAFHAGGRIDLVAKETAEVDILQSFLPQALEGAALDTAIDRVIESIRAKRNNELGNQQNETLPKNAMALVIAALKSEYPGQIDMGKTASIIKAKLV